MSGQKVNLLGDPSASAGFVPTRRLRHRSVWKRLGLNRVLAITWLAVLAVYALVVPLVGQGNVDLAAVLQGPSSEHIFGTDGLGRDLFFRAAEAVRSSLLIAAAASVAAALVGCVIGAVAALSGPRIDQFLMRVADLMGGLPATLLAAVIASMWPGRGEVLILVLAVTHWIRPARIVRAGVMDSLGRGWIDLARASGVGRFQMWMTHILPPIVPLILSSIVVQVPHALWFESTLSFLGLGLPADQASLGLLLEEARVGILSGAWWLVVVPGGLLVVTALALGSLVMSRDLADQRLSSFPVGLTPRQAAASREAQQDSAAVERRLMQEPEGIAVAYDGGPPILTDAKLPLHPGSITLLEAPSGEGKSTVLQAEAGVLPLAARQTKGMSATASQRGVEVVYAPSGVGALNPVRKVGAQLRQTLRTHGTSASRADLERIITSVGLDASVVDMYPGELSGGMARRASLVLALATPARILLLDEPTGGLDRDASQVVCDALAERAAQGTAIAIATHDMRLLEAADLAADGVAHERPFGEVPVRRCVLHSGRIMDGRSADLHLAENHPELLEEASRD